MTYDTIATISQVTSLLMFVGMFAAVLAYALWPRNGPRFDEAQRRALDLDRRHAPEIGRDAGSTPAGPSLYGAAPNPASHRRKRAA